MRIRNCLRLSLLALALMLPLVSAPTASACPNCKDALASQGVTPGGAGDISAGFSRSILLMMAMPFALLGVGTVAIVRLARRGGLPRL